ncbi:site-specific DNA-methyltransferase [Sphingomonas sanguinis]|uniref:site-specific DNA-methyltransferase (adenine-specific) n=1 Tax=Sphingomonas sanguinis TaxID=33051 RepID=A0A147I2I7_9SPHN|nr:site-specific DNA-methyltransferase [Sphingomonas sanguinis]KTT72106.1 DNA methylase [Sphingomonas sanguinis]
MPILDWMTRGEDVRAAAAVPYRLLEAVPMLDGGDADAANMLIQGDNLDALKALLPYYKGAVKCIYIDPPYNTRSAFEHYDDNLEHSQWLAMIYPRLVLLRELLAEDGSIWVSIDDNEGHYLKVVMDEVFGRRNFLSEIIWQKRTSRENRAAIGLAHDTVLAYGKMTPVQWKAIRNPLPPNLNGFSNPDADPRGPWRSIPFSAQGYRPNQMYVILGPNGEQHEPPRGRCWGATEEVFRRYKAEDRVYFPRDGAGRPRIKQFAGEEAGLVPMSLWLAEDVGTNEESKREILSLFDDQTPFGTPKPERLIQRILHIASNPGDLVLDSFLGSGTTAAVAHKMGRRWIGAEMGDHAETHCKPRLDKVIAGEQGGVSEAVGWTGGGGYRYYRLGAPVFEADGHIADGIRFATLAAHIWFSETGTPFIGAADTPMLGMHDGMAYALLYNGILGDRSVSGGNVLTAALLERLRTESGWDGPMTVYGEWSKLGAARLAEAQVVFKQTPYDVKAR